MELVNKKLYDDLREHERRLNLIYKYLTQFLTKLNYHYNWNGVLKFSYIDYINMNNLLHEKNCEIKKGQAIANKIYKNKVVGIDD